MSPTPPEPSESVRARLKTLIEEETRIFDEREAKLANPSLPPQQHMDKLREQIPTRYHRRRLSRESQKMWCEIIRDHYALQGLIDAERNIYEIGGKCGNQIDARFWPCPLPPAHDSLHANYPVRDYPEGPPSDPNSTV